MKTPRYICSKCRQPFTRRWNAYRHSNTKHYGGIENILSFTEYITNQKDSSIPLNAYSEGNNSHHSNVKNQIFFDKSIYPNNLQSSTLTDPFDDAIERELFPYELLAQLGPKYEEIRHILEYVAEPSRKILLGKALLSAINSDNPIETMNKKLIDYRKSKTGEMMLNDLAAFYGQDKAFIKEFLKLKFKQNKYYRQFSK
jgi:hypothetical protein